MAEAIVAYLHYLSIFLLFALQTLEHQLFKPPLDLAQARSLLRIDAAYGICAVLVLLTGAARVIWFGKGVGYYMSNSVFHAKVGLFILVGLLSIIPTVIFLKWRNSLKVGEAPQVSATQGKLITMTIRLELLLLLIIPLLGTLMARGFGVMS